MIVYESKTQSLTATSSTEAEFIAACDAAKAVRHVRFILRELGFAENEPTKVYIDNQSAIKIINDNQSPTVRTCHVDIRCFAIQDWKEDGDVAAHHIPGIINPSDDLTKPSGWVLHSQHCRRLMGHHERCPELSSKQGNPLLDSRRVLEIENALFAFLQ